MRRERPGLRVVRRPGGAKVEGTEMKIKDGSGAVTGAGLSWCTNPALMNSTTPQREVDAGHHRAGTH
jgi:hypothetical protein